jgi:hypothetical protein
MLPLLQCCPFKGCGMPSYFSSQVGMSSKGIDVQPQLLQQPMRQTGQPWIVAARPLVALAEGELFAVVVTRTWMMAIRELWEAKSNFNTLPDHKVIRHHQYHNNMSRMELR